MNKGLYGRYKLAYTGLIVGVFTAVGVTMVSLTQQLKAAHQAFNQVLQPELYDNHPLKPETAEWYNRGEPITVYQATLKGKPIATLLSIKTRHGYNGRLSLLMAILADGSLSGVEVLAHQETAALGDKIESKRSDWLKQFHGATLISPVEDDWVVKCDSGEFDQIAGTTVSSPAVINSIKQALTYLHQEPPNLLHKVPMTMKVMPNKHTFDVMIKTKTQSQWDMLNKYSCCSNQSLLI